MPRRLLTNARTVWIKSRKHTGTMKGGRMALPAGVQTRYADKLKRLAAQMTATTQRQIEELFKHPDFGVYFEKRDRVATIALDAVSPASQARILTNALRSRFQQLFNDASKPYAETFVDQTNAASASATYSSLKELSGGLSLKTDILTGPMKEFLKSTVATNVELIRSIPSQYFTKVQNAVTQSITQGKGLEDLTKFFEDQDGIERRRAENIARDQTRKTYNGLNKQRMQAVGVQSFEWLHSGGGLHPRPMHQAMHGKIYRFDNLPVIEEDGTRGIPGQAINCGCTMRPVMQFEGGKPS